MCQITINVFFQSLKLVFSLIGDVLVYFVFNINVTIFSF